MVLNNDMTGLILEKDIIENWQSDDILVSVCCTAYNHKLYIEDALRGFLSQKTNFAFEIVISDDCSTDGTTEVIQRYLEMFPNIIKFIYQEENQYSKGALPIRDFILPNVSGKYIALCEGDDYWIDSTKLQKQVDFLELNPQFMGCGHNTSFLERNEEITKAFIDFKNYNEVYTFDNFIELSYLHTSSIIYRYESKFKEQINEYLKLYSNVDRNDYYMLLVFSYFGPIKYINQVMSVYRVNDGGIWNGVNKEQQLLMFLKGCLDFSHIFDRKYTEKFVYSFINVLSENSESCSNHFFNKLLDSIYNKDLALLISYFAKFRNSDIKKIKESRCYINELERQLNDNSIRSLFTKFLKTIKVYSFLKNIKK
ncbi:glycosyl transferase [Francisella persica ATCC VR-331]|nr:glycosyltransferase family A protein [Francisella persica]ANH77657.1 glycosyl transferase [Francisella persica ATCC VR-331]